MIVDYRKRRVDHSPIQINGAVVERVESFKFLCVHITNILSWSKHTKNREEGITMPFPPQETEKIRYGSPDPQLYSCTIESILTGCISLWYGNCSGVRP
jgi:hypothetical protein